MHRSLGHVGFMIMLQMHRRIQKSLWKQFPIDCHVCNPVRWILVQWSKTPKTIAALFLDIRFSQRLSLTLRQFAVFCRFYHFSVACEHNTHQEQQCSKHPIIVERDDCQQKEDQSHMASFRENCRSRFLPPRCLLCVYLRVQHGHPGRSVLSPALTAP